jgi:hypothetical protein
MIVISQPRYLPAITYCQRLFFADKFVILDNVQRQTRGFENRNRVLVNGEKKWITIPSKSSSRALIRNTAIQGNDWIADHKQKLYDYYSAAPYFDESYIERYYGDIDKIIDEINYDFTETLIYLIKNLCSIFHFSPDIIRASSMGSAAIEEAAGPDKLLEIAKFVDADIYVSGLNGREYGIIETFQESNTKVKFHADTPERYDQKLADGNFEPNMAFFDALFYAGYTWLEEQIKKEPKLEDE